MAHALDGIDMDDKFTPGPWEYVPSTDYHGPYVTSEFGSTICDLYWMTHPGEPSILNGGRSKAVHFLAEMAEHNARLISLAPEMAAFIARIAERDDSWGDDARALLVKAGICVEDEAIAAEEKAEDDFNNGQFGAGERLNPWLRIKDLLADMDGLERRIRQAEQVAYEKAHIHFRERTRDLVLMNEHLLSRMASISALQPMSGMVVDHIDGDITNNDISNLRFVNPRENTRSKS